PVHVRVQGNLDAVGAFCSVDPDLIDALHPDRIKDQKQLLPGLIASDVKADRKVDMSPFVRKNLNAQLKRCQPACSAFEGEPV
ncbi:hypothetical protein, partial [Winogradskyella poriferorum]|uniref:hypothetical protein n=1 Tax=Winogradskyella poriferorum TaxID=307627 RepID=UPI003D64C6A1